MTPNRPSEGWRLVQTTTELLEKPLAPSEPPVAKTEVSPPPACPETVHFRFSISPRRVGGGLAICAFILAACHVLTVVYHYEHSKLPWAFLGLFDLDEEESFGTWFSSGLLCLAGLCSMLCAMRAAATARPMCPQWWFLGFGFVLLSLDEVAGMHESLNSATEMSWAIPGGILAVVIGLAYAPFLFRLPRATAVLCVIAGAIYIGGAVGVELATEGYLESDQLDTLEYNLTTVVEEWMEMTGVILFIYAVLRFMSWDGRIEGEVEVGNPTAS